MEVEQIRTRIYRGGSRRTPLFAWLWDRHGEFAALLAEQGQRKDWKAMAEALAEAGVTGGKGKPPTGQMVRQTWAKVAAAAKQRRKSRPPASGRPAVVTMLPRAEPAAMPVDASSADDPLARLRAQMESYKTPFPKPGG